jgi:hypothetical protein
VDEIDGVLGGRVQHLHGRGRHDGPGQQAEVLELAQPLDEHPVGDAVDRAPAIPGKH